MANSGRLSGLKSKVLSRGQSPKPSHVMLLDALTEPTLAEMVV